MPNSIRNKGDFVLEGATATSIDAVGFSLRRRGVQIRDCICVQKPEGPSFLLVGQVPSDQTFVEQVVRGVGSVLDIDRCRISTTDILTGGGGKLWSHYRDSTEDRAISPPNTSEGRFPANLLLRHGPSCYVEGTKRVGYGEMREAGSNGSSKPFDDVRGWNSHSMTLEGQTAPHSYGAEDIPNWICVPSCPVAMLDRQSGNRPGCKSPSDATQTSIYRPGQGSYQKQGPIYGDEGGASRFFKQVQTEEELDSYLKGLVRNNS